MKVSDIDPARRETLQAGLAETTTLVESFAVDFAVLLEATNAALGPQAIARVRAASAEGIVKRMALVGRLLAQEASDGDLDGMAGHRSDTVRGWVCFAIAARPDLSLVDRIQAIRRFADDAHFGVREWAWLALRPYIAGALDPSLAVLTAWTAEPSPRLRRFASEATRPRGVWCAHLPALKANPALGLPILEPLRADTDRYVQDSVGNWLNDAAKTNAAWVLDVCDRWTTEDPSSSATAYIRKRALRNVTPATRSRR